MKESFHDAIIELKRADHLIYVSLKYTRTIDVFRHIVERMISYFELLNETLLKKAKSEKKIFDYSDNQAIRCEKLKEIYDGDETIVDMVAFYTFLRKVIRSDYKKAFEYRRNVTMYVVVDDEQKEITIDEIHVYYDRCKEYLNYIKEMIQ